VITALKAIQALVAVGLIVSIVMQSGRAAGLGAIAGGAETLFGRKKNMDAFFSKLTIGLGIGFMVLTLLLAVIA
jgi:preprotein translocase subunit SecG